MYYFSLENESAHLQIVSEKARAADSCLSGSARCCGAEKGGILFRISQQLVRTSVELGANAEKTPFLFRTAP